MQKLKKQKIQEMLDSQNASIDADMVRALFTTTQFLKKGIEESDLFWWIQNNKGKGRLKYLLQQTELFSHFAKGDSSSSQKKAKGRCVGCNWLLRYWFLHFFVTSKQELEFLTFLTFRGRHASKVTEEEEDEEYLKEEEDGLAASGNTRLLTQPSCKYLCFALQSTRIVY